MVEQFLCGHAFGSEKKVMERLHNESGPFLGKPKLHRDRCTDARQNSSAIKPQRTQRTQREQKRGTKACSCGGQPPATSKLVGDLPNLGTQFGDVFHRFCPLRSLRSLRLRSLSCAPAASDPERDSVSRSSESGHVALVVGHNRRPAKSGGERAAVQTLREIQRRLAVAKRLDCACL